MNQVIKTITVYAASSSQIPLSYLNAGKDLGVLLAKYEITTITGGGNRGLMAAVADASLENGGQVIGVIPRFMKEEGWVHETLSDLIVTPDMHTRKQIMAERSDACIAMPGGVGTLEELLEIITWKQLGLYSKPVVILNIDHYYDGLLHLLNRAQEEKFMHRKHKDIWHVAYTPEDALEYIRHNPVWESDPRSFAAL